MINKAESVLAFQGKVIALRDEWVKMQVPPRRPGEVGHPKPVYIAKNDICWKNNARWARQILVNEGLMAPDSPRGIWEITPAGREALKAL